MAYAYWKSGKTNDIATFDLYFRSVRILQHGMIRMLCVLRKNPFKGEFTIFAGLGDCVKLLENFHYSETDISYLRTVLPPSVEEEFYEFLQTISPKDVSIHAVAEGSVVFPRVPLMRVTGTDSSRDSSFLRLLKLIEIFPISYIPCPQKHVEY